MAESARGNLRAGRVRSLLSYLEAPEAPGPAPKEGEDSGEGSGEGDTPSPTPQKDAEAETFDVVPAINMGSTKKTTKQQKKVQV